VATRRRLAVLGPAGGLYGVLLSQKPALLALPPLGFVFVELPALLVGSVTLDPVTGRATVTLMVPDDPSLEGLVVCQQALAGVCLSNAVCVVVLR
jgi:hypothetical protein